MEPHRLATKRALGWWSDDSGDFSEIECLVCLRSWSPGDEPLWSKHIKLPLKTFWSSAVDHLLRRHGAVLEDPAVPVEASWSGEVPSATAGESLSAFKARLLREGWSEHWAAHHRLAELRRRRRARNGD